MNTERIQYAEILYGGLGLLFGAFFGGAICRLSDPEFLSQMRGVDWALLGTVGLLSLGSFREAFK